MTYFPAALLSDTLTALEARLAEPTLDRQVIHDLSRTLLAFADSPDPEARAALAAELPRIVQVADGLSLATCLG